MAWARFSQGKPREGLLALDSLRDAQRGKMRVPYEVEALYALLHMQLGRPDSADRHALAASRYRDSRYNLLSARLGCMRGDTAGGLAGLREYLSSRDAIPERVLRSDTLLRGCWGSAGWAALWKSEWYGLAQIQDDDLRQRAEEENWEYLLERLDAQSKYARNRPKYAYLRALALRGISDTETALDVALSVAKRNPKVEEYVRLAADLSLAAGRGQTALRLVESYIAHDRDNPAHQIIYARVLEANRRYRECVEVVRDYQELYPGDDESLWVGVRAAVGGGHWMQGLSWIARLLAKASADRARILRRLRAEALVGMGSARLALDELRTLSPELDGDSVRARIEAQAHFQLGDRRSGCASLRDALRLGHPAARGWIRSLCPARATE